MVNGSLPSLFPKFLCFCYELFWLADAVSLPENIALHSAKSFLKSIAVIDQDDLNQPL
jgi:hypothetical protein